MTVLMGVVALVFWLNRRDAVHGWAAVWLASSATFLAARLGQMLNGSAEAAPDVGRIVLTASLFSTWGTFFFAGAYAERRPTSRDFAVTGAVLGLPLVLLWCSNLVLTHEVVTRVLWGRDAYLGARMGPLYVLFPVASTLVTVAGILRLSAAPVVRTREGALILGAYVTGALVLVLDVAFIPRAGWAPRITDFSSLLLGLVFTFAQVRRYAGFYDELENRVIARTQELAAANERLREEHLQRELLLEQFAAAQRMEALGRLAGGVAHDFNNLLTVILGNASVLRSLLPPPTSHEFLSGIEHAGQSAAELTRQLLVFGRKDVLERRVVDLRDILTRLRPMLARLLGDDVRIDLRVCAGVANASVDPTQIEQIAVNLAVNARDAMPDGGTLVIELDVVALDDATAASLRCEPGPYVRIAVSDTGVGMVDEVRTRVFEPFFTTKPTGKGTGLGLSIVYAAVKQNDGALSLESEPSRGTTFRILFPLVAASEKVVDVSDRRLPRGSERIWLVEDQPLVRSFVENALSRLGYAVRAFASAEHLLDSMAALEGADLLLTDLVLPRMDGRALAERVVAARPTTRVVFASGYSDAVDARHGALPPGAPFVSKPFTVEGLANAVRAALDKPGGPGCRHVLVIDDDPMNLTVVAHLLESLGCAVTTMSDPGAVAATLAAAAGTGTPIDLLLLDNHLEGASGLETCRRLRQSGVDVAIVCMSGDAGPQRAYEEAGFDGLLAKPIDHDTLRSCVERYAGWSHARALSGAGADGQPAAAARA
jgi:signal transduction histidine kinase/CheY-like chemotaxis protein